MKIRTGFVSNSSTSSFLIYGYLIGYETYPDDVDRYEWEEELEIKCKGKGIQVIYGQEDIYLGDSWSNVKDDETGGQFKERIRKAISEVLKKELSNNVFRTHREAWRNG